MAKAVVIDNVEERQAVRSSYKNAHCRPVKLGKGFYVFHTTKDKKEIVLGFDENTRAGAWVVAAREIGAKMVKKLES